MKIINYYLLMRLAPMARSTKKVPLRTLPLALTLGVATGCTTSNAPEQPTPPTTGESSTPIYLNEAYSPAERAANLVSRLTLDEKASQMNSSQSAAIPRLRIPAYGWWNEALHGAAREGTVDDANPPTLTNTTSYPVSLSLGSTWNPDLMYREARMISSEMREVVRNHSLDLNIYSPTVNLGRDPRWGRNDETFSEDPYLTSAMASQYVDGMEGKNQEGELLPSSNGYLKTATTIKHFAANNSEFNRLTGSSDMDERTLREYYTAQFRDIIHQSHPASIMSSYNAVNGTPTAADVHLIDTLARQTFGFKGFFTSDCDAIYEIQHGHHWQPPGYPHPLDEVERHAFANAAGEDLDCQMGYYDEYNYANMIPTAIEQNIKTQTDTYNENDVDTSLTRLFTTRIRLGEFDDPRDVPWIGQALNALNGRTWINTDANDAITETPDRLAMARRVGDESIVLLKNSITAKKDGSTGKLLPLDVPKTGSYRVAVVGHYANPDEMYLGGYSSNQGSAGEANEVNGYQGLKKAIAAINPNAEVDYLPGVTGDDLNQIDADSINAAADYDAVIVYVGTDEDTASEDTDRDSLALPGAQAEMINQIAAQNPNTIVYMETIGEVDVTDFEPNVATMLWSSYNGQRKGEALADVALGNYNPSGHLPFTWYRDDSQLPPIGAYSIRADQTAPGRTYQYFQGTPSYSFGYGLSYTQFSYSNLHIDRQQVDANGTLHISADVTNNGSVKGDDVVQLYVTSPNAAASERPRKRLRGFDKVTLNPGQTKRVKFAVPVRDLAFFDPQKDHYVVNPGTYGLQLATSSADDAVQQQASVEVTGTLDPRPSVVTIKPQAAGDAAKDIAQRVIFPTDTTIVPQVTVAMSDESLYGYIHKGASKPLPDGMTVTYRSNRPDVVTIDAEGVHTVAPGVATITAVVHYQGHQAAGSFVIDVEQEQDQDNTSSA